MFNQLKKNGFGDAARPEHCLKCFPKGVCMSPCAIFGADDLKSVIESENSWRLLRYSVVCSTNVGPISV